MASVLFMVDFDRNLCVVVAVVVVADATSDDDAPPYTIHDDSLRSSDTAICIPHNEAL